MDLFTSKKVVGLFDNQEDLGQAVGKLHERGFGQEEDDLLLIDKDHLSGETPILQQDEPFIVTPLSSSGTGGATAVPTEKNVGTEKKSGMIIEDKLTDLGIDDDERSFYAQHLRRGNTLVVVEADDDEAAESAQRIMKQTASKVSIV